MEKQKNIILYVMSLPGHAVESIRDYEKQSGEAFEIFLIRDSRLKYTKGLKDFPGLNGLLTCDFSKPHKIAETLLPYQDRLVAITCRADTNMMRFRDVIPHVPYLRTPTTESLAWASDKYEMRKRFRLHTPKHTPAFTKIKNNTKAERQRVIEKVGFPLVVKPTNLALSMLVDVCYHEEELEKVLRNSFRKLKKIYADNNRDEQPNLIAEEYLEGLMYSVDSYVNSRGEVTHCPIVRIKLGRESGHPDSFSNYLQMTPTALKKSTVETVEQITEEAIHALGLRSVTTHTELMKVDDDWKIIEVGARTGGFRHILHKLSCDIDHSMNDLLIRMPRKPVVPKKCKGYAAAMKWYARKEGEITAMKGIKKIEELQSFSSLDVRKKVGDRAVFARNGGRSVFDVFLYNSDRSKLLADIRRIEQTVDVKVKNGKVKK